MYEAEKPTCTHVITASQRNNLLILQPLELKNFMRCQREFYINLLQNPRTQRECKSSIACSILLHVNVTVQMKRMLNQEAFRVRLCLNAFETRLKLFEMRWKLFETQGV